MGRIFVGAWQILQRSYLLHLLVFGTFCAFLFMTSKNISTSSEDTYYAIAKPAIVNASKIILLWTPFYDVWDQGPLNPGCPRDARCHFTHDRRLLHLSDVVVFHCRDISLTDLPPMPRQPDQKWLFFCMEPPPYSYFLGYRFMGHMFNWSMTYRLDSDVPCTYGMFRKRRENEPYRKPGMLWKNKNKMAYWMVSHCKTHSRREDFVDSLKRYVDVDIFGQCGTAACPRAKNNQCHKSLSKRYKFVFALENSLCTDYITEKLFEAMAQNIVPVVFGGSDYSKLAPTNSFIDALSFKSPKDLADHLQVVADNETLYRGYLRWKEDYVIDKRNCACDLCSKISAPSLKRSVYQDLGDWWVRLGRCHSWRP